MRIVGVVVVSKYVSIVVVARAAGAFIVTARWRCRCDKVLGVVAVGLWPSLATGMN